MALKLRLRSLREGRRIPPGLGFRIVEQGAQRGPRTRVANDAVPRGIAVQLGQKRGQIRDEFFALRRKQGLNGGFDFLRCAHGGKLPACGSIGKLASGGPSTKPPAPQSLVTSP